jgi:hypothetical protein
MRQCAVGVTVGTPSKAEGVRLPIVQQSVGHAEILIQTLRVLYAIFALPVMSKGSVLLQISRAQMLMIATQIAVWRPPPLPQQPQQLH